MDYTLLDFTVDNYEELLISNIKIYTIAIVISDIPDYSISVGIPAKVIITF